MAPPSASLPRRPRRASSVVSWLIALFLLTFGVALAATGPVGAHAGILGSSPSPGSTVGGTIEGYDVWFDQTIVELYSMGLATEAGTEVPGEWSQPAPNLIRFTPDEVQTNADNYILSYKMLAEDGDTTRSAFVFTYEPDAAPPEPAPADELMPGPASRGLILAGVAAVGALLAGGTILLRRRTSESRPIS